MFENIWKHLVERRRSLEDVDNIRPYEGSHISYGDGGPEVYKDFQMFIPSRIATARLQRETAIKLFYLIISTKPVFIGLSSRAFDLFQNAEVFNEVPVFVFLTKSTMQLSEHFKLSEFVNSPTAKRLGIDNTPNQQVIDNLTRLCQEILEPLRAHINEITPHKQGVALPRQTGELRGGKKTVDKVGVSIASGYRCPQLNKAVGGVKNSQHQYGEAADIHLPDEQTGREWFLWIMDNLQFDQLIWEGSCKPSGTTSSLDDFQGAAEARRSQKSTPKSTHHWIHVSYRKGNCRQQVIRNLTKSLSRR